MRKFFLYSSQLNPEGVDLLNELNDIKDSNDKKSRVKEIEDILNKKKIELKENYIEKSKTNPLIEVKFELKNCII